MGRTPCDLALPGPGRSLADGRRGQGTVGVGRERLGMRQRRPLVGVVVLMMSLLLSAQPSLSFAPVPPFPAPLPQNVGAPLGVRRQLARPCEAGALGWGHRATLWWTPLGGGRRASGVELRAVPAWWEGKKEADWTPSELLERIRRDKQESSTEVTWVQRLAERYVLRPPLNVVNSGAGQRPGSPIGETA